MMFQFELDNQDMVVTDRNGEEMLEGDLNEFAKLFIYEFDQRFAGIENLDRKLKFLQDFIYLMYKEIKEMDLDDEAQLKYAVAVLELTKVITNHV